MGRLANALLILTSLSTGAWSQTMTRDQQQVILPLAGAQLRLQAITANIFRVTVAPPSGLDDQASLSVIQPSEKTECQIRRQGGWIHLNTAEAGVRLNRSDGSLVFLDARGRERLTALAPGDTGSQQPTQNFIFPPEEALYGLGQFEDGILNLRGREVLLGQANRVAINPFLVSSAGSGVLWDNASLSRFRDGEGNTRFRSESGEQIEYYVVIGRDIDQAIAGYRTLTGQAPLFPKWAYGYFQSKERYRSEQELLDVVGEYRRRRLPLDVIVQDWAYWGGQENFSGMVWDPQHYPDPKAMTDSLHALHARLMVSIWPAFGSASPIYQEMSARGFLFPEPHWSGARVYDAFNPEARALYWQYTKKALFDVGVDAWWMDGTEPEFRCTDDRYATADAIKAAGPGFLGDAARTLNAYSLMTTRGIYEGQRAAAPQKRVFILTRSAFSGQQRYAAATWSGDTAAGWECFRQQITAGLTFSLSGLPYWTADIGGFLSQPKFPRGAADPAYRELYVRWFQFGAFCPIFRAHGTNTPREIWQFGEPGEWSYEALATADCLRYRLLPYIYSQAWQVTSQGGTMMRALPMDFPDDPLVRNPAGQFMFGPALLVCPVTRAVLHPPADASESIPGRCLFGPDGSEPGLTMQIFDDLNFVNEVLVRKLDQSTIGWSGCIPLQVSGPYSLRWEGQLRGEVSGEHTLLVRSDGGLRLWLDGRLYIDALENHQDSTFRVTLPLQAGQNHALRLEHRQFIAQQANLRLAWIKPESTATGDRISLYLPASSQAEKSTNARPAALPWYDFWSGETLAAGDHSVKAVLEHLPLYVCRGAILPLGPELQYSDEKPTDPLEIRIYAGQDGVFVLYEDEMDSYRYEQGAFTLIPLRWDESRRELHIGRRQGSFPGMLSKREFHIVLVRPGRGTGLAPCPTPDRTVLYSGEEMVVACATR